MTCQGWSAAARFAGITFNATATTATPERHDAPVLNVTATQDSDENWEAAGESPTPPQEESTTPPDGATAIHTPNNEDWIEINMTATASKCKWTPIADLLADEEEAELTIMEGKGKPSHAFKFTQTVGGVLARACNPDRD